MTSINGARGRLRLLAGVALATLLSAGAAAAQAQSDPLVDLLVKRGVLSAEDAARLPAAPNSPERDALVRLLVAKGVLTEADLAGLSAVAPPIEELPGAPPNAIPVYAHADHPTTLTLGPVDFTFSGFIDNQMIYRSRNLGGVGTNFNAIPYSNGITGNIGEFRDSLQNSRLAVKTETHFPVGGEATDAAAYVEVDFLGNDASNTAITSNSHTLRLRQAFVDIRRGDFEVLGGQAWSWLTPNRQGVGSYPADVFTTDDYDVNYNVGLTWARQPVMRFVYHPDPQLALGVSIENPDQFGGQNELTFPAQFNPQLGTQIDQGAGGVSIPNLLPDVIPKVAYDADVNGHRLHLEAVGLLSFFQITDTVGLPGFVKHHAVGYGGSLAGNLELTPGLTAFASGFASHGGGRYAFGLAPDIAILPNAAGTDIVISPANAFAGLFGLEWQATGALKLSGYWGFVEAERDFAVDTTSVKAIQPFVGFGFPNSPNNNNRWINEASFDGTYTIWANPMYGTLQTGLQYAYMEREPWFAAAGSPRNASLHQVWWDFRYILP